MKLKIMRMVFSNLLEYLAWFSCLLYETGAVYSWKGGTAPHNTKRVIFVLFSASWTINLHVRLGAYRQANDQSVPPITFITGWARSPEPAFTLSNNVFVTSTNFHTTIAFGKRVSFRLLGHVTQVKHILRVNTSRTIYTNNPNLTPYVNNMIIFQVKMPIGLVIF